MANSSKADVQRKLADILTSKEGMSLQIDVTRLSDSSSLSEDLALDSIQVLEFGLAIEQAFGVSIVPERFAADLDKFGALVAYIARHEQPAG